VSEDEKFVREHWGLVARCDGSYRDYPKGTILVQDVNHHWFNFGFWSAAAEFTRERLEQVRQVEEEIAWLTDGMAVSGDEEPIGDRILARLKEALAALKKGMKDA
jgi:hypothetical protein